MQQSELLWQGQGLLLGLGIDFVSLWSSRIMDLLDCLNRQTRQHQASDHEWRNHAPKSCLHGFIVTSHALQVAPKKLGRRTSSRYPAIGLPIGHAQSVSKRRCSSRSAVRRLKAPQRQPICNRSLPIHVLLLDRLPLETPYQFHRWAMSHQPRRCIALKRNFQMYCF